MSEKSAPTNEMVLIIRPSFKKVCGPDACRAALYNHILYRLARKAKDEPETRVKAGEVFWYASAEDICQDIDEAWCVNKVRKEIKQLVTDGLLGQRHNPAKGWDRKYQYFIGPAQGEKLLAKTQEKEVCLLHIGLNAEVTHLLHMVNAFDKNGACICQKSEMDLPETADASTKNGGAIPKGSTEGSSEESTEGSEGTSREDHAADTGALAPTPAHSLIATDTPTTEDELNGHIHDTADPVGSHLPGTHHLESVAGDRRRDSVPAGTTRQETTSERVAPNAATPDSGYEKDDEDTVKLRAVSPPRERTDVQLSTSTATYAQGSGKVSAHVEPKVLDVRTLTLKAHASYIFQWLDIVKREAKRDGRACYARTKTDEGRIVDLITSCWNSAKELTEENVRKAWLKMWNEPTWKNGFSWKKAGISIKAFCEHYSDYLEKAWDSEQKQERKGSSESSKTLLPTCGHMTDEQYAAYLRG